MVYNEIFVCREAVIVFATENKVIILFYLFFLYFFLQNANAFSEMQLLHN